jgi:hypothetical protein
MSTTRFCGTCCSKPKMCENCMEATLLCNGLSVNKENMDKLRAVESAERSRWFGANAYTWVVMDIARGEGVKNALR